ncbi:membrane associated signaling protein [Aliivibrio wodanis]|uniref:Membrane associated signaling protein n=1 Tax=Aliivibrio wodanis TaxID=80852 RepID=A0A090K224_9GAMM|nr:membrane associated signaling protein [Aliivibrio wodanis]
MDVKIIFFLLLIFYTITFTYSFKFITMSRNYKSQRVKILSIYIFLIFCLYLFSIEGAYFSYSISEASSLIIFILFTVSAQILFINFWISNKLSSKSILSGKEKNNGKARLLNTSRSFNYYKIIDNKIKLGIPFSVIKLKINNHKKLIDASSSKTFGKLVSYSVLVLKKSLSNNHIELFCEGPEMVLVSYSTDQNEIKKLADTIYELVTTPILMEDKHYLLQPIMGCVIFSEEIKTTSEIIKRVDIACYKAKKLGIPIDFYRSTYTKSIHEEVEILNKLIYAIPNNEFELFYQPIVNSTDKSVHGYEALIRWPQKDGSMIPPDKFICIAEENNYIKRITQWVVNQVACDLAQFKREGLHPQVHINISALDLHDDDLYKQLFELVTSNKLIPSDVILEVTESALMSDIDIAYLMLSKLSELGFYISIDDFGTGFSSLSLLRVLSFNQIKIDQSFIRNMAIGNSDYAIVASTIYLAHSLGCNVVAEGVESEDFFIELKGLGCDYIQGYVINKPQSFVEIVHWSLKQIERDKLNSVA